MSAGAGVAELRGPGGTADMPVPLPRRMAMRKLGEAFIGIDAAEARNAVAVADEGRDGEVRYLGEFDASPEAMRRLVRRLAAKYERLRFCYEAGPTGYGLHRLIVSLGHGCVVVAPVAHPAQARRPGEDEPARRDDAGAAAAGGRAD